MPQTALCPSCDGDINISSDMIKLHMQMACPRCGEPLVVIDANPLEFDFDDKIKLLGYDIQGFEAPNLKITFYWQALGEMDTSYKVFTHLLGQDGKMWGQKDDFPGAGTSPTTSWVKNEVITDSYEIPLDADAPAGAYTLEFGFYDPASGARLPATGSSDSMVSNHALLPEIEISR